MRIRNYVKTNPTSREVTLVENAVSAVFDSIYSNPLLQNYAIISGVVLRTTVDNVVNHTLGKNITGFIIIRANASADVYESSTVNTVPGASVILKATSNVTVSILFF